MTIVKKNSIELKIDTESCPLPFAFDRFYIDKNSLTILQGPNGVGKSSLLNIVDYNSLQQRGEVSYCFQEELQSFSSLSLHELGKTFSLIHPHFDGEKFQSLIHSYLEKDKLPDYLSKNIADFSGGERQMIKVALFLALDSDLYIFDEPFNHLSQTKIDLIKNNILSLLQEKKTILIVDHGRHLMTSERLLAQKELIRSEKGTIELSEESQL